jgi:hypothetical protein
MKTANRTLAASLLFGISIFTAASAQPKIQQPIVKQTIVRKLPANMNETQFRQRISTLLTQNRTAVKAQQVQSASDAKKIYDGLASERTKITTALNSDARYKTFMSEAQRISSGKGSSDEKATQLQALAQRNQIMFREIAAKAGIDRTAMQSKLQKIAPGFTVSPDFTIKKSTILKSAKSNGTSTIALAPSDQEIVLRPPFSYEDFEADNQGIAFSDATGDPNANEGKTKSKVTVIGVAGAGTADSEFGEFISVPEGVKRMEVIIKAKTSYSGNALGVIGTSGLSASVSVRIGNTESSSSEQNGFESKGDLILAPVAWYAEMEGGESGEYRFSFDVPANKRDYLIAGSAYVNALGAGAPGYASGTAKAEIDKITVRYIYQ